MTKKLYYQSNKAIIFIYNKIYGKCYGDTHIKEYYTKAKVIYTVYA